MINNRDHSPGKTARDIDSKPAHTPGNITHIVLLFPGTAPERIVDLGSIDPTLAERAYQALADAKPFEALSMGLSVRRYTSGAADIAIGPDPEGLDFGVMVSVGWAGCDAANLWDQERDMADHASSDFGGPGLPEMPTSPWAIVHTPSGITPAELDQVETVVAAHIAAFFRALAELSD